MDNESIHFFDQIHDKADNFLRHTIGEENYLLFKEKGYLEMNGTNNGIYRITQDGEISKIVMIDGFKEFVRKRKKGLVLSFAVYLGMMISIFMVLTGGQLYFYSVIVASLATATLIFCSRFLYKREMGNRTVWKGEIHDWHLPIEDCIAICYMNIKFDSNRFDRDKGCGLIYIPNERMYSPPENIEEFTV